jgi:hypothetical protein
MAMEWSVTALDAHRVAHNLHEVADRAWDHSDAYRDVMDLMESAHERAFAALKGRYVLTGATKASLTGQGAGSIRRIHNQGLAFGSSVEQASYITMAPRDAELFQIRKPRRPDLRSAVVVAPPEVTSRVADLIGHYIVEPF